MERMDRAPHWRAASSHPARCYRGATDMLQCYNSLLLIASRCLISFERVITSGGFTVCKQTPSIGEWWHCVIRGSCDCFCSGSDFGCVLLDRHEVPDAGRTNGKFNQDFFSFTRNAAFVHACGLLPSCVHSQSILSCFKTRMKCSDI